MPFFGTSTAWGRSKLEHHDVIWRFWKFERVAWKPAPGMCRGTPGRRGSAPGSARLNRPPFCQVAGSKYVRDSRDGGPFGRAGGLGAAALTGAGEGGRWSTFLPSWRLRSSVSSVRVIILITGFISSTTGAFLPVSGPWPQNNWPSHHAVWHTGTRDPLFCRIGRWVLKRMMREW